MLYKVETIKIILTVLKFIIASFCDADWFFRCAYFISNCHHQDRVF